MSSRVCVVLTSLMIAACSSSGSGGSCPQCLAGQVCSPATGYQCVPAAGPTGCPATGCGASATCRTDNVCTCSAGFVDCNQDLGLAPSNGCECQGGCAGAACAATPGCSPSTPNACGHNTLYCAATTCLACPPSTFNCDGVADCEETTACGVTSTCSPASAFACGTDQYCNGSVCTTCEAEMLNCDGINGCESAKPCDDPPPVPGDCDPSCTEAYATFCVKNPARGNLCEECLTDAHCTTNPRSHGPHCNTTDLAGTGANWCVCTDHSECASSTLGKKCNLVDTAVPKAAFKQCTCEVDADCNAPYIICEGGSSGFGRCRMPCREDDPATPDNEDTCYWAGMVGKCDVASGKCDYSDH